MRRQGEGPAWYGELMYFREDIIIIGTSISNNEQTNSTHV